MTRTLAGLGVALTLGVTVFAQATYNPAAETQVSGTIRHVISAQAPDGSVGVHLEVVTPSGPVRVHLAPAMFIGMNNFSFLVDEKLSVKGAKIGKGADEAIWAREVTKDGKTLVLRNTDGSPRWPNATVEDPDGCGVAHGPIRF